MGPHGLRGVHACMGWHGETGSCMGRCNTGVHIANCWGLLRDMVCHEVCLRMGLCLFLSLPVRCCLMFTFYAKCKNHMPTGVQGPKAADRLQKGEAAGTQYDHEDKINFAVFPSLQVCARFTLLLFICLILKA